MTTDSLSNPDSRFPTDDPTHLAGLGQTHVRVAVDPQVHPPCDYSIVLPRSWRPVTGGTPPPPDEMTRVGLFVEAVPDGSEPAAVQVFRQFFPIEVGLRDWIQFQAETSGIRLTYCRDMLLAVGPAVDAGGDCGPPDRPRVVRMVAHASDGQLFLINATAPADRYAAVMRDLMFSTQSFQLTTVGRAPRLEQWVDGGPTGTPAFTVGRPASWHLRPVPVSVSGKSGVDLLLETPAGSLAGYVRVKAIGPAAAPAGTLLGVTVDELAEAGVRLAAPLVEDDDPTLQLIPDLEAARVGRAASLGSPAEVRAGIVRRGGLTFAITLISELSAADRVLWMRCKRAYHIALVTAVAVDR